MVDHQYKLEVLEQRTVAMVTSSERDLCFKIYKYLYKVYIYFIGKNVTLGLVFIFIFIFFSH